MMFYLNCPHYHCQKEHFCHASARESACTDNNYDVKEFFLKKKENSMSVKGSVFILGLFCLVFLES